MLNVLKQLQEQMTSKDDQVRAGSTHQFKDQLQAMEVNEIEAELLFEFFLHKLSDSQSLDDTTEILLLLSKKQKQLNSTLLEMIKQKKIYIPAFSRIPRLNIYCIFLNQPINHQLAIAILSSIAGEKDPRNILVAFQLIEKILSDIEIAKPYREEILEFLDCYYPIELDERADKRFNIAKPELEHLLNKCFFCNFLIKHSILILQDKIVSPYDRAQGSALQSVIWILQNTTSITPSMVEDIYESIQKLTEQVIMDDQVIEQIPQTLKAIVTSKQYKKLSEKILTIAFKTVEEIPASQPGYIYCNLLKLLISTESFEIFQKIVSIFNKKFDVCNVNVAQKRLEIIIKVIAEYDQQQKTYFCELESNQVKQLIAQLLTGINHNLTNVFILSLKCLLEIICHCPQYSIQIENYLFTQILQRQFIEQKCILDYFMKNKISNITQYEELVEYWYTHNQLLFIYSIQCSLHNIENYCQNLFKQHILKNQNEYLDQCISQIEVFFVSNQTNMTVKKKQSAQLIEYLLEIDLRIQFKSQLIKHFITVLIAINPQEEYFNKFSFSKLLKLEDTELYYYIPFFQNQVTQQFLSEVHTYLQNIEYSQINNEMDQKQQKKKYIYKLIYCCLKNGQSNFNMDYDVNLAEITFKNNKDGLNQLDVFKIILHQQMIINNEKAITKINAIALSHPKLLKMIIKQKDINQNKHLNSLLIDLIKITTDEEILNYLLNLTEEEQVSQVINTNLFTILINHFNDQDIDKLKHLSLIVNMCELLKLQIVEVLLKLETTDIKVIFTIMNIVMNKFEEVRYNVELYNKAIATFNKYLQHPKRIVRKAAQEAVNEWCIVFGKSL